MRCSRRIPAQHRGQRQALGRPLHALPQHTGIEREQPLTLLADSGFFSEHDLNACSVSGITPLMAEKREAQLVSCPGDT